LSSLDSIVKHVSIIGLTFVHLWPRKWTRWRKNSVKTNTSSWSIITSVKLIHTHSFS